MSNISFFDNLLQVIFTALQDHDKIWQKRQRKFSTLSIFFVLIQQIGSPGNLGLQTILTKLQMCFPSICPEAAPSSIHAARYKVGWTIFSNILTIITQRFESFYAGSLRHLWKGHRAFAVDATTINVDHSLKDEEYKPSHPLAHYPLALVSALYSLKSEIPYHCEVCGHKNERKAALSHFAKLRKNDVVVYDRGYLSMSFLTAHIDMGIEAVFRLKKSSFKAIGEFMDADKSDEIITLYKKNLETIKFRCVRYKINNEYYYLGTTLLDQKRYKLLDLKNLYHARWGIEELFKVLKKTLNIEKFHTKNINGIKQEIGIGLLLIALTRLSCILSKRKEIQASKPNIKQAISNIMDLICDTQEESIKATRTKKLKNFLKLVAKGWIKFRHNRHYPRRSFQPKDKWRRWGKFSKKPESLQVIVFLP